MSKEQFEKIVNHVKVSGFVYPGSEIYGCLANSWDYGPLGVEMKNNIKIIYCWRRNIKRYYCDNEYIVFRAYCNDYWCNS